MQVRSLDELGPEHELGVAILRDRAFGEPNGTGRLRRKIELGYPYAPYRGLYVVEGAAVHAMIEMRRLRFTSRKGEETMGGLAYVSTRPGVARMGLARGLIAEALTREKSEGIDHVLLWTGRSMVAHALYEKLGFVDVLSPPLAYHQVPGDTLSPPGYVLRTPEPVELPVLEALHSQMAQGGFGFTSRYPGAIAGWIGAGKGALSDVHVLERAGTIVGYSLTRDMGGGGLRSWESISPHEGDRLALLQALEGLSRGRLISISPMPTAAWGEMLSRRGYVLSKDSWGTLMALTIGAPSPPFEMRQALGTDDPHFLCQLLDDF
jgi:GNAT superfamily N-acetyltransferase